MDKHTLDQDTVDRLLDGDVGPEALTDEYRHLASLVEDLRLACSDAPDPAIERSTVRAMAGAVPERVRRAPDRHVRRPFVPRLGALAAAGAATLLASAGIATAGGSGVVDGLTDAIISLETADRLDAEEDARDLAADRAEREREEAGGEPVPDQAEAGLDGAAGNRAAAAGYAESVRRWAACA